MEEYIGRNALLKEIADLKRSPWYNDDYGFGTLQARHEGVNVVEDLCIKKVPAIDAVEVVRCGNCEYYKQNPYCSDIKIVCMCWPDYLSTDPDDFCSYGIRKKEDE